MFVGQTYSFHAFVEPKLESIHKLAALVNDDKSSDTDEDFKIQLEKFETFLTDEDDNLKLLEDYRNYFRFDIHITSDDPKTGKPRTTPLSKVMGVLSGGQRQAPYYVAIAAAMSSTYYPNAKEGDDNGIGLVIFDEAFDKLDIPNTQRLIHLFEEMNLQVIVAAPEEKRNSLIECVSSIISVQRIPSTPDLFMDTEIIGPKAKHMMLRENPIHRTIDEYNTTAKQEA